jgi:hypothetical protein
MSDFSDDARGEYGEAIADGRLDPTQPNDVDERVTVLARSETFMAVTNAKEVNGWKESPKGSGVYSFNRVVNLQEGNSEILELLLKSQQTGFIKGNLLTPIQVVPVSAITSLLTEAGDAAA